MLDFHFKVLTLDELRFGPFYDQLSVRNRSTGEFYTAGGAELVPDLMKMDITRDILHPMTRATMYIKHILLKLYGDTVDSVVTGQTALLPISATLRYLHDLDGINDDISAFPDTVQQRVEYRDVELLVTTTTNVRRLDCNSELNAYMMYALIKRGDLRIEDLFKEDSDDGEEN
ncbi:MAG: hypothetical protein NC114_06735 [Ruminococcus flavefaciens]|nr:hypothetical protein [Ruminococcus flavefaciens]